MRGSHLPCAALLHLPCATLALRGFVRCAHYPTLLRCCIRLTFSLCVLHARAPPPARRRAGRAVDSHSPRHTLGGSACIGSTAPAHAPRREPPITGRSQQEGGDPCRPAAWCPCWPPRPPPRRRRCPLPPHATAAADGAAAAAGGGPRRAGPPRRHRPHHGTRHWPGLDSGQRKKSHRTARACPAVPPTPPPPLPLHPAPPPYPVVQS